MRTHLTLTALLVALVATGAAERPEPLTRQPVPSVKLSAALGWRLSGVATLDVAGNVPVLIVGGDVFNISAQERPSPILRFALRDAGGAEIYYWTARLQQASIKPDDWAPFEVRLEQPSPDARVVEIATLIDDGSVALPPR
jgi:hypothetical protein